MANYQTYKKIQGDQAVINNSLGPAQVSGFSTAVTCQMMFSNCNYWSPSNGGCCCNWTAPGKALTIKFEVTSGGGTGGGGRCCTTGFGQPGGGGAYGVKQIYSHKGDFTPGSSAYTICAGGTTRCSCCGCCHGRTGCGFCGCTSYVQGPGLNNFCAFGGNYGRQRCGSWCYNCQYMTNCGMCWSERTACSCGADWQLVGQKSSTQSNYYCHTEHMGKAGGAAGPYGAKSSHGRNSCSIGNVRGCCLGHSLFPGGGGFNPITQGGNCWGDWGQGGLVVVTYWA